MYTLFFFYKNKVYKNSEPQNRDILRTSLEQFEAEKFKILRTFEAEGNILRTRLKKLTPNLFIEIICM